MIKLNVDAVALKDHRRLAIIAWDEYEKMIKAWAKDHVLCDSIMAKDYAILWGVDCWVGKNWDVPKCYIWRGYKSVLWCLKWSIWICQLDTC